MTNSKLASVRYNRAGGAICLHFLITIVVNLAVTVIFAIAASVKGIKGGDIMDYLKSAPVTLYGVAAAYLTANISGSAIALSFCGKREGSLRGMFSAPDIKKSVMLLCIPAAMMIQSVSMLLQSMFSELTGSSGMENIQMPELISGNLINNIVYVAYIGILGPVAEELLFRGAVMKCMNFAGRWFAIFSSAFLFALFHGNIMQGIIAFLLGIFFGWLDMKSGSVIPSVILHITNNMLAVCMSGSELVTGKGFEGTPLVIYISASIAVGAVCMFLVLKDMKPRSFSEKEFFVPDLESASPERKSCGVKAALRAPLLWLACIIYVILIMVNI